MKTTSIFSLLALTAYALVPACCSPAPNCDVGQTCANNIARDENVALDVEAITPSAQIAINYILNPANEGIINWLPACFWSGHTVVQGVTVYTFDRIDQFKDVVRGCNTVHFAVGLAGQSTASTSWPRVPDWAEVSIAFAQVVSDQAYVLLGEVITPDAIWPDEEQELSANGIPITRYLLNNQGQIDPI